MRLLAGIERNIGGNPVVGMVRDDILIGNPRLGIALLAPRLNGKALRLDDRARTRHLSRREARIFGRLHVIALVDRRWRNIGNGRAREQKLRAGVNRNRDLRIIGDFRVGRNVVRLATINLNRNRTAIAAFAIECGQNAAIIAARLGQQSGGARSWSLGIRNETGSAFNGGFQIGFRAVRILAVARGRDLDGVGLRVDDVRIFLLVLAPQTNTKDLERQSRRHDERGKLSRQQKHGDAPSLYRPVTPSHTRYCPVPVYAVAWRRPVHYPQAQDDSGITIGRTEVQATTLDMDHFSQWSINVTTPLQLPAQIEALCARIPQ